jgi:hypothetical protein
MVNNSFPERPAIEPDEVPPLQIQARVGTPMLKGIENQSLKF